MQVLAQALLRPHLPGPCPVAGQQDRPAVRPRPEDRRSQGAIQQLFEIVALLGHPVQCVERRHLPAPQPHALKPRAQLRGQNVEQMHPILGRWRLALEVGHHHPEAILPVVQGQADHLPDTRHAPCLRHRGEQGAAIGQPRRQRAAAQTALRRQAAIQVAPDRNHRGLGKPPGDLQLRTARLLAEPDHRRTPRPQKADRHASGDGQQLLHVFRLGDLAPQLVQRLEFRVGALQSPIRLAQLGFSPALALHRPQNPAQADPGNHDPGESINSELNQRMPDRRSHTKQQPQDRLVAGRQHQHNERQRPSHSHQQTREPFGLGMARRHGDSPKGPV